MEHLQGFGVGFPPECVREFAFVELYNCLRHRNRPLPQPGRVVVFALHYTTDDQTRALRKYH